MHYYLDEIASCLAMTMGIDGLRLREGLLHYAIIFIGVQ